MSDNILLQINKIGGFLLCFLLIALFASILMYMLVKDFKPHSFKVKTYGLFLNLRNIDIIMLSANTSVMFVTIYLALNADKAIDIYYVVLVSLWVIWMLCDIKKILFCIINLSAEVASIYLISLLKNYQSQVDNNLYVKIITICLIAFTIMYAVFVFLTNLEKIVTRKTKKVGRLNEKK